MCDSNCIEFGIEHLGESEIKDKRVLEVGSYDVNGSLRAGVMKHGPKEYVGVDIAAGPGVDVVCSSDDILTMFREESFDVVISTCALEHVQNWKLAISNIKKVCREGGIILIIVPSMWPWHNFPHDFWRYSLDDMKAILGDCDILVIEEKASMHIGRIGDLVYVKARKPMRFVETNLQDYKLYSITSKVKI